MSSQEGSGGADGPADLPPVDRRARYALIAAAIGLVLAGAAGSYVLVMGRSGLAAKYSFNSGQTWWFHTARNRSSSCCVVAQELSRLRNRVSVLIICLLGFQHEA